MRIFTIKKASSILKVLRNAAFLFCLSVGLPLTTNGQVILNTQVIESTSEEELTIAVTVDNFTNIGSFQFSLNWDISALAFKELTQVENVPDLTEANFNLNVVDNGELSIAWFSLTGGGTDLATGSELFHITFTKLTEVPSALYFDNTPTRIEFATPQAIIPVTSNTNEIVIDANFLIGKVVFDESKNCMIEESEKGLEGWLIEIKSDLTNRYRMTDKNGNFYAYLPIGDFIVTAIPPPNNYFSVCESAQPVTISATATEPVNIDFTAQAILECPSLNVEIATPFLRRCFENTYTVSYNNNGTADEDAAYITVALDPFQTFLGSTLPSTEVEAGVYRFDIGKVAYNSYGNFKITVNIDCETTTLGQTHCVTAKIFPDLICETPAANWSGASLSLESECVEDKVQFRIKNIGEGNMDVEQQFIVIEDMIMLRSDNPNTYRLAIGETKVIEYAANGSTYRLETNQVPSHPEEVPLSTAIEGCGTNEVGTFSTGMINMFRTGDESQFVDEDCQENRGAFDPNDKNAFPAGYNTAHYIAPNTDITYHVRFQNTGTDTAFNIVVLDTLSEWLDVTTLVPLVSSHPYELTIVDSNILKYSFENIMLPDSNVNLMGSNGFFKFKIAQKPDVPLGTLIENSAAIYFDFNEPVITNTYFHTVGFDFVEIRFITATEAFSPIQLKVSPNPTANYATIEVKNPHHSEGQFELFDLQGRKVQSYPFTGNVFEFQKGNLAPGMYLFEISAAGAVLGTGKLMVKE